MNAVTLLVLMAPLVEARTVTAPNDVVRPTDALDSYQLLTGSGLTVQGAATNTIGAQSATLVLEPNSQTQAITAFNSTITINGSNVSSAAGSAAIQLSGSTLTLNDSQVTSTNSVGLAAARALGANTGSTVNVTNSQITGATRGVSVSAFSAVDLNNTNVQATAVNGTGATLFNGTLRASNNTRIVGAVTGVAMDFDSASTRPNGNSLILNHSSVEGQGGSAILVRDRGGVGVNGDIQVLNGSTLKASNEILLDVQNNSTANMSVDNSVLVGNIVVETGSTAKVQLNNNASLKGELKNVAQLDVNSGAQWELVNRGEVDALKMGGGTVVFGSPTEYFQLDTNSLTGNGTFAMHTNFNTGETDLLNVNGNAEGNHKLLIAASGAELGVDKPIKVVHTQSGGAQFGLVGDTVDAGAYEYGLKQEGTDWYLDTEKKGTSTSAKAVLALANAAPAVLLGEASVLRTRMGEVRFGEGKSQGLWMRGYGNKIDVAANSNGVGYSQNQAGLTIGADWALDELWTLGVMGGYSNSSLGLSRGSSGMVNSYYAGVYGILRDDESGVYVDLTAKVNRLNGQSQVNMSDGQRAKGKYSQDAVSASVEVGKNIKLDDDGLYIEPFAQLAVAAIGGSNYTMDNGLKAKSDRATSAIGKVGVTAGKNIQLESGGILQPYLRTAVARDFSPDNKVYINDQSFKNNLSGGSVEVAGGIAVLLSPSMSLHAEATHSKGKAYDQPWGATVGLQVAF
ncbi:MAG: autotransporter outer membrane beta-barrel domain-containing protein [Pseudomonas sp.]|uniref:autotransporter outer membrane beta-barrel domain-containing protein n=1 Tax=Pseudomonas sp. TaxID=306 RepID=UPI00391A3D07